MPPSHFQRAAYPERTGEAFIYLVDIVHDEMPSPYNVDGFHFTNGEGTWNDSMHCWTRQIGSDLYFAWVPFEIEPPGQSDEEQNGKLIIPNIDLRIGEALEAISSPAEVKITCVLESDPSIIIGGPYEKLLLQNVQGDALVIEGDLRWPSLVEEPWPKGWINPGKYLAAFRATA